MGLLLSFAAFVSSFLCGRRSVGAGMAALLVAGYFYGILRARFLDGFSHFIFDAAVFGLYVGHLSRAGTLKSPRAPELFRWAMVLMAWPAFILVVGVLYPQHLFIQLVGLRAAIWFLPFLLLGSWARPADQAVIAVTLAVLNLIALLFGVAEYVIGIEPFFPRNAVTAILYLSKDIADYTAFRIPATFTSSAAYGGTMAASLPWLISRWASPTAGLLEKLLLIAAVAAAALGIFLCGSRTPVIFLFVLGAVTAYQFRLRLGYLLPALVVAFVVAYFVSGSERLQRFASLQDRDMVSERIKHSTNMGVAELVLEYPLGAGLGTAFGTSIPSFLAHLAPPQPIGAENEYARIGVEQSLVGVVLWFAFLTWLLARQNHNPAVAHRGQVGAALAWWYVLLVWLTGFVGCGVLLAIPGTPMLLFMMGILGRTVVVPAGQIQGQLGGPELPPPPARGVLAGRGAQS
jgi:hypothetical protein